MAKTQPETFIRRSVVDALRRAGWFVIYNMQMALDSIEAWLILPA